MGLYGAYSRTQSGKAHHGCEDHVDRFGADNILKSLFAGIDLDVGTVGEKI